MSGVARMTETTCTVAALVSAAAQQLRAAGIDTPQLDAEILIAHAMNTDRVGLRVRSRESADAWRDNAQALIDRRASGEPVQYITGVAPFRHLMVQVDPRVLIPRPETELLVTWALEHAARMHERTSAPVRIVDVCTGSGCVALAIQTEAGEQSVSVCGSDISAAALEVARANAQALQAPITWIESDLLTDITGPVELITANPPYIARSDEHTLAREVRDHEPALALFLPGDGENPVALLQRLAAQAIERLVDGGHLAVEIGMGQHESVAAALRDAGFTSVSWICDLQDIPRIVTGTKGEA